MESKLVKVRVYYKNPIKEKTRTMKMRESLIDWYK